MFNSRGRKMSRIQRKKRAIAANRKAGRPVDALEYAQ